MDLAALSLRRRRWLLYIFVGASAGYAAYRTYHLPSITRRRRHLAATLRTLAFVSSAATDSAAAAALISSDLAAFIRSDSDDIPQSLKQLAKLASSKELLYSASKLSESFTVGVSRGISCSDRTLNSFSDSLFGKLCSPEGAGFCSIVVGSFARNLVLGFYQSNNFSADKNQVASGWVRVICTDEIRKLLGDCVQRFATAAVTAYLERTKGVNGYNELFAGLTNPKHEEKVKEILVSVCNGAIETLVKTSHSLISASNSNSSKGRVDDLGKNDKDEYILKKVEKSSVMDKLSSTFSFPGNRKFVLDVTGRVTFETVRSLLEFLLLKLYDGARRSVKAVHKEVIERGLDVVRYVSAKSMVVATMCLTLCIHMILGARLLMPA